MSTPIVIFLSSTSMHFPLDLAALLAKEGQEILRIDSTDAFFCCPERNNPYLAVLEVGSTDDLDRALLAYEWCEQIQPLAPCRFLLLLASKNIVLGDKGSRFGNAEVAHLPLPFKNLLFKVELQKRLLTSEQASGNPRGKKTATGFSCRFIERPPNNERVLLARGPGPQSGHWQEAGESPLGRVRWRWVAMPITESEKEAVALGVSWVAESRAKPVFETKEDAWAIVDPEAELLGFKKDKRVYSALAAEKAEAKAEEDALKKSSATGKALPEKKSLEPASSIPPQEKAIAPAPGTSAAEKKHPGQEALIPGTKEVATPAAKGQEASATQSVKEERKALEVVKRIKKSVASPAQEEQKEENTNKELRPLETRNITPAPRPDPSSNAESKAPAPFSARFGAHSEPEAKPPQNREESTPSPKHEEKHSSSSSGDALSPGKAETSQTNGSLRDAPHSPQPEDLVRNNKAKSILPNVAPLEKEPGATAKPQAEAESPARQKPEAVGEAKENSAPRDDLEKIARPLKPPARPEPSPPAEPAPEPKLFKEPEAIPRQARSRSSAMESNSRSASGKEPKEPADTAVGATESARQDHDTPESPINIRPGHALESPGARLAPGRALSPEEVAAQARAKVEADRKNSSQPKSPELAHYLKYRHFVTMTLEELQDRDSSWHLVDGYRIYLSVSHRYYGVKDANLLLPIWIYEGELAPEFLEKQRAWKFYDRYPELYSTLDTLPPQVLDHVQILAGTAPGGGAFSTSEAKVSLDTIAPNAEHALQKETAPKTGLWSGLIQVVKKVTGLK